VSTGKYFFWGLNAFLSALFLAELVAPGLFNGGDGLLVGMAALASIAALQGQLPLQNILPAALLAAVGGGLAHALSANSDFSLPFGPIVFTPAAGAKIFNAVPWTIPLLWVIAIFNGRGLARLILRPWRKAGNYGVWLIGLAAVLAMAFDVALEPYAWHARHFWFWQPTRLAITWQGAPLLNFPVWACVALLILLFASPWFIRKQPGEVSAPDLHPLFLWLGALTLFAAGAARLGQWWPVAMDAGIGLVTATFAVRGLKW
jgi:uncharacterized membrane protein